MRYALAAVFTFLALNAWAQVVLVPLGRSDDPPALVALQALIGTAGAAAAWGTWIRARWAPVAALAYGIVTAGMLIALVPLLDLGADARGGLWVGAAAVMLFALGSAWYLRRTSDAAVILTPTATHRMLLVAAAVFAPHVADAQATRPKVREGDSSIVVVIDAQLGALYPTYRPADALLTSSNPLGLSGAVGTEVQGFQGTLIRPARPTTIQYGLATHRLHPSDPRPAHRAGRAAVG